MLNDKKGVITEERFRKMTTAQWLFHYHEIMGVRESKAKLSKQEFDITSTFVEAILNAIESVGLLANPEIGMEILNKRKNKENLDKIESGEDELLNYMNEIDKIAPKTISVAIDREKHSKFFLRKYKRSAGITINKKE